MTQIDEVRPAESDIAVQGTPCWFELTTPDLPASQLFYAELFGWNVADSGMEGMTYLVAQAGGDMVAGMMAADAGVPSGWLAYISVKDCDGVTAAAKAAGGRTFCETQQVPGVGRFSVVADPQGAAIGVLQGEAGGEGGRAWNQNAEGHASWLELTTPDTAAALGFYTGLFGWAPGEAMNHAGQSYQMFAHQGAPIGGILENAEAPPYWLPYFGVDSASETLEKAKALGAEALAGPIEVPGPAWIAHLKDPQGCVVAVVGGRK